jgi:predicted metalloprotease with PDZ domain
VLRRLYEEFYVKSPKAGYYLRGRGFTGGEFERAAAEVGGAGLKDLFERHVRGVETPPYDEALGAVGLRLAREVEARPAVGLSGGSGERGGVKVTNVRSNSPAEGAGFKRDDLITHVGDTKVTERNFADAAGRFKQGEPMLVTVNRDGQTLKKVITPAPPDTFAYRLEESPAATPEQRRLREAWMEGSGQK